MTSPVEPAQSEEGTENESQESAFIAASRRTDRSFGTRLEWALQASRIHERRTGHSIRMTEQDIFNGDISEEDDDLPAQYHRLTAHLQTTNATFNRRLQSYLAIQVAVRAGLGLTVSDAWNYEESATDHKRCMHPDVTQIQRQSQPVFQSRRTLPLEADFQSSRECEGSLEPFTKLLPAASQELLTGASGDTIRLTAAMMMWNFNDEGQQY